MIDINRPTDEQIYIAHAHELMVCAASLVGPDRAADVVSDAVVAAMSAKTWPTIANPRAYLYRAVFTKASDRLRRDSLRTEREQQATGPWSVELPDFHPEVQEAVNQLSAQQRAVIVLTYWKGLGVTEVAEALDISDGSVRKHLARARARLREVLHDG